MLVKKYGLKFFLAKFLAEKNWFEIFQVRKKIRFYIFFGRKKNLLKFFLAKKKICYNFFLSEKKFVYNFCCSIFCVVKNTFVVVVLRLGAKKIEMVFLFLKKKNRSLNFLFNFSFFYFLAIFKDIRGGFMCLDRVSTTIVMQLLCLLCIRL